MQISSIIIAFLLILNSVSSQDCPPGPLLDQAYIRFFYNKTYENGPTNLIVNYTLSPCFDCLTQNVANVTGNDPDPNYILFTTQWPGTFYIYNEPDWSLPDHDVPPPLLASSFEIQQNGNFTFVITDIYSTGSNQWQGISIQTVVDVEGDDIWVPVYIAVGILVGVILLYNLIIYLRSAKNNKLKDSSSHSMDESRDNLLNRLEDEIRRDSIQKKSEAPKGKDMTQRVQSLDTFRGITLAIMIFVNAGGGAYAILDHSIWNGIHFADLVFPWFIWMMGFSMAISFQSQTKKGATKRDMMAKVLMRTFKLVFLSFMTSEDRDTPFNDLRIPGVLMRFAVSYFFVSLIIIYIPKNEKSDSNESNDPYKVLRLHLYEFIVVCIIIGIWLVITFGMSVPGCPTGYIGPGGLLGSYGMYPDCTGGAAGYIDKQVLGISHIFQWPTCKDIYLTGPFDPEGILGCLTSIALVYFGLAAGRVLVYHKTHTERLTRWGIGAIFFGIITMILSGCSQNDGIIPVNKNLWSLSFITLQCCTGLIALSFLYIIVDIQKYWGGGPFRAMGMNSIIIYCASDFLAPFNPLTFQLPTVNGCPNPQNNTHGFNLALDLWNTVFFLIIANWMDYDKFYINL